MTTDKTKKAGRPPGMRVIFCKACHRRVTGLPRKRVPCKFCGTTNTIPDKVTR